MNTRFWVVGGKYTDTAFTELVNGSERVMGPYLDREAALIAWRRVADQTRGECCVRFAVVEESARLSI